MVDNQYSWLTFFKKIMEFFRFIVSFFKGRKNAEDEKRRQEQKEKFDKATNEIKTNYDEIDKEKENKKEDDLDKRVKNLF